MKTLSIISFLSLFSFTFSSAQTELWHIADSTYQSGYGKVLALPYGGMFVVALPLNLQTNSLFKYDENGNVIFRKLFSKPDGFGFYWNDERVDQDGNLYVAGSVTDSQWQSHGYLSKIDSNGNQLWEFLFAGLGQHILSLTVDSSGNIYTIGHRYAEMEVCKFEGNGNLIWAQHYSDSVSLHAGIKIALDNVGNVITLGNRSSNNNGGSLEVIKYTSDGNFLWAKTMHYSDEWSIRPYSISVDENGNILTCGDINCCFLWTPKSFPFAAKFSSSGDSMWLKTIVPQSHSNLGTFLTGDVNALGEYFCGGSDSLGNSLIIKLNPAGDLIWSTDTIPVLILPQGIIKALKVRGSFLYAAGNGSDGTSMDYLIVTIDFDGNVKWYSLFDLEPGSVDDVFSLDLDEDENVLVSGNSTDPVTYQYNVTTVKYGNSLIGIDSDNESSGNFIFYPNPASSQLEIIPLQTNFPLQLKIINTLGQILFEEKFLSPKISVNVKDFPAGIYFVEIENQNQRVIRKFVKQ